MTAAALGRQEANAAKGPFSELAAEYDTIFSRTSLGQRLRQAVWNHLDRAFRPGTTVVDLGCGTGEDAIHLAGRGVHVVAVDREREMLAQVEMKAGALSLAGQVKTIQADLSSSEFSEAIRRAVPGPIGGAYSNFGALNCVGDLRQTLREVASLLPVGASFLACVMGPVVPWEWAWFLLRGAPSEAFRRLRDEPVEWRGLRISYPPIASVCEAGAGFFRIEEVTAIGALLPPSYVRGWIEQHPALLDLLDRWERKLESSPPLALIADHYLARLTRV